MPTTPDDAKKTLILTGASRGIGHATVKRFASAGWRVITCSRHGFPENCPWEMGPEDHIQVDLSDPVDTLRAIGEMREWLKSNYDKMPKRKNTRVTCCYPKGDVVNYAYNNGLEWPNDQALPQPPGGNGGAERKA